MINFSYLAMAAAALSTAGTILNYFWCRRKLIEVAAAVNSMRASDGMSVGKDIAVCNYCDRMVARWKMEADGQIACANCSPNLMRV